MFYFEAARGEPMTMLPAGTWWWHREPDGRHVLWPKMTLEYLNPLPITNESRFRCVFCKTEGTAETLQKTPCTSSEWYHGDIRFYRQQYTPMRCLGKDSIDGLPCCNEWIRPIHDGFAGIQCPACGSSNTEEIPS